MTAAVKRFLPAVGLLLLCLLFAIRVPQVTGKQTFLTLDNGFTIAGQYAWLLLAGMGATVVIISGGIDLSVGSLLALSGVVAAQLILHPKTHLPVWAAMPLGVAVGAGASALVGLLVTKLKVPAFIASLGMLLIARGVALKVAGGSTVSGLPDSFGAIANGRPLGIPVPLILVVLAAGFVAFLLHYTKFGRYVYAIGSNAEAARVSGVPVERVQVLAYVIGGALAGVGGLVEAGRLSSGNPTSGQGYELDVVTAVVVGGASLAGGEGRVSGTILGALLIAVLHNGASLLNIDSFDQNIYIGLLIVGAVALDQKLRRLK
jgi:ribose transport system permease protein